MIGQGCGRGGDFEVIVVGAGPAGSTAAWSLARAGVRVLLIDGCMFPRSKPCGEAVSPGATPLLAEMGVLDRLDREGATRVTSWRLGMPDGSFVSARFGPPEGGVPSAGLALSRGRLDAVLRDAALAAGAEFRAPLRVYDVERSAEGGGGIGLRARDATGRVDRLRARWVVGADGLRSVVARRVVGVRRGRRDRLAVVGRYRPAVVDGSGDAGSPGAGAGRPAVIPPVPGMGELRLSVRGDGCLGTAPIEDGLWTVGVVVPRRRAPELSADPSGFFRAEVASYDFPPPTSSEAIVGGLEVTGPFEVTPGAVSTPGVVLTGDAAGYFDPFTGQGIYRALVTGRYAADTVLAALTDPGREAAARRAYADALHAILVPGRRVQRLIDAIVNRPRLMNPAGRLLARRPGLLSLLLDVTGDRCPPGRLLRPAALAAAWTAIQAKVPSTAGEGLRSFEA